MIIEMTGSCAEARPGGAIFVDARVAKTGVAGLIVVLEIQVVLDQGCARTRIVANTIAANPGIYQWQRYKENDEKPALASCQRQGVKRRCRRRRAELAQARPFAGRRQL